MVAFCSRYTIYIYICPRTLGGGYITVPWCSRYTGALFFQECEEEDACEERWIHILGHWFKGTIELEFWELNPQT